MVSMRIVKIATKKSTGGRMGYAATLPKDLLKESNILIIENGKEKLTTDILVVKVITVKINEKEVKGLFFYKP